MNGEPFYDNSTQQWRPLSPKTTPQSSKFAFFPYEPSQIQGQSPDQAYGWMDSHTPMRTPAERTQGIPAGNIVPGSRSQPRAPPYPISAPDTSFVHPYSSQSSQGEFPSGSFVEHFNSTTLDDPFTDGRTLASSASAGQMRTPPPTRDESSRRKSNQSRMVEFQTPSTIVSRRMSVPNEAWHTQGPETSFPAPSPFTFTPLQFSPPSQFGFTPSGPMTAPVYPQSNVFWEPGPNHAMNQLSFSPFAEEPYPQSFNINMGHQAPQYVLESSNATNHRIAASESFRGSAQPSTSTLPRPQSARPAHSKPREVARKPAFNPTSAGVDPNMLWNAQGVDTPSIPAEDLASGSAAVEERQNYQPYQHQLEALKREKEEGLKRPSRGSFGSHLAEMPIQSAQHGLHRSLTDSRARRNANQRSVSSQATFNERQDTLLPSQTAQIHRQSSPLKRHRSNSQADQLTPTKTRARRSVVLTVDEQGRARTEIKQVMEDPSSTPNFQIARSVDGSSDSSELSEALAKAPVLASSSEPSPGPNDAQNALREVVRNRKLSRRADINRQVSQHGLESYSSQDLMASTLPAGQSRNPQGSSYSNNSPTTITDPEFHTPTSDLKIESLGSTRCVCEGRAPEDRSNLMVECDSCKNWLHVACLGMTPEQIPPVFVCLFCTGSTPATRGGRVRTYSGNTFARVGGQDPSFYNH